jgi:hypothetical protein
MVRYSIISAEPVVQFFTISIEVLIIETKCSPMSFACTGYYDRGVGFIERVCILFRTFSILEETEINLFS